MDNVWNGYTFKKVEGLESWEVGSSGTVYVIDHHEEIKMLADLEEGLYVFENAPKLAVVDTDQYFAIEDGMLSVINCDCGHVMEKVLNPKGLYY